MKINVTNENVKVFNARFGYNRVFGLDVDERKMFTAPEAIARFGEACNRCLRKAIEEDSEKISADDARGLLKDKHAGFVRDDEEQRRFWLMNGLFVAQLKQIDGSLSELSQLWFIPSSNPDPRTLYVTFETVEIKKLFCDVAAEVGWKPEELGEHLLLQFIETIRRSKVPSKDELL